MRRKKSDVRKKMKIDPKEHRRFKNIFCGLFQLQFLKRQSKLSNLTASAAPISCAKT
jgi:hypothetical protein